MSVLDKAARGIAVNGLAIVFLEKFWVVIAFELGGSKLVANF